MKLAPQEIRTFFVTSVTWGRRSLFRAEPMAELFLETMLRYRKQVLMPDHFHLLLTPAHDVSLEKAVQLIKGGFSFRVKKEMEKNLEIWQPGPTEHRIKDAIDYDRHVKYIHENPVKRGLVENPEEYPYGSASGRFDLDEAPPGLKPQALRANNSPG